MNGITDNPLDGAREAVQRAVTKQAADRAALFTFDGKTPINAPDLHQRELDRIAKPVQDAVDRAVALADKVTAEVEALRLAPYADPTSQLSAADLADANARAQFIKEDCATLPLDDLVERLRAVHASGNKASTWLHDRYAKSRWRAESDKVPQHPDLSQFAEVLRDLGIVGPKAGLSRDAQKRLEDAGRLRAWSRGQLSQVVNGKGTGNKISL